MARSHELTEHERDQGFMKAMRFLLECREEALRRRAGSAEAVENEVSPEVEKREAERLPPVRSSL